MNGSQYRRTHDRGGTLGSEEKSTTSGAMTACRHTASAKDGKNRGVRGEGCIFFDDGVGTVAVGGRVMVAGGGDRRARVVARMPGWFVNSTNSVSLGYRLARPKWIRTALSVFCLLRIHPACSVFVHSA